MKSLVVFSHVFVVSLLRIHVCCAKFTLFLWSHRYVIVATGATGCLCIRVALNRHKYHREHASVQCQGWFYTLTLSQCTLAGPVYIGMPLECHWLTQCTLGYHWATQLILAGYTGTSLEKLSWNSPTLECHWRNLVESAPHWDANGETLNFTAYTGTPLEGLWQLTHDPTHIVKHAE